MKRTHDYARMRRMWVEGMTADVIAAECGLTANGVHAIACEKGWPRKDPRTWRSRPTPQRQDILRERWLDDSLSMADLCRLCGYQTQTSLSRAASRMGLPQRKRGPRPHTPNYLEVGERSSAPPDRLYVRCECGGKRDPHDPLAHPACPPVHTEGRAA